MKDDNEEEAGDPLVSIVIFEWQDEHLIGRYKDGADPVCGTCQLQEAPLSFSDGLKADDL